MDEGLRTEGWGEYGVGGWWLREEGGRRKQEGTEYNTQESSYIFNGFIYID